MAAMILSRQVEFRGLVDHRIRAGKTVQRGGDQFSNMLIGYAPGVPSIVWDPDTAYLVKAGSPRIRGAQRRAARRYLNVDLLTEHKETLRQAA